MPLWMSRFPQQLSSLGSQEQILPNMVSSSTDLHHRVADINKGDIIYAGMVAVHTRCLLYCLHVVCIWWTQVARGCLAEDFRYLSWFWNLVLLCSVSMSSRVYWISKNFQILMFAGIFGSENMSWEKVRKGIFFENWRSDSRMVSKF